MRNLLKLFVIAASISLLSSCQKDQEDIKGEFYQGVFVVNEGAFLNSNASLSFINKDNQVENQVFARVNSRPLGDVFQSMSMDALNYYLVINNSSKIEVVDRNDLSQVATLSGLNQPRYSVSDGENLFVSQWGTSSVEVFSVQTLQKIESIQVGSGPEEIILNNGKLWVANGGYGMASNTISVIDLKTLKLEKTISLSGEDPKSLAIDNSGNVWVLCSGHVTYSSDWMSILSETPSKLIQIDQFTYTEVKSIELFRDRHPSKLAIDKANSKAYYGGSYGSLGVYRISLDATLGATDPIINEMAYGFNIDSESGRIYVAKSPTFSSPGSVEVYSQSLVLENSFSVGIGPNSVLIAK